VSLRQVQHAEVGAPWLHHRSSRTSTGLSCSTESQPQGENDVDVSVDTNTPSGVIKLKRKDGELKVDRIE